MIFDWISAVCVTIFVAFGAIPFVIKAKVEESNGVELTKFVTCGVLIFYTIERWIILIANYIGE